MDLITFLTLVGYAKDVFSFCWKRLEFKELFTETGAAIATIYAKEATHDNDADQMIQILFSDSQMKTLAEKCDGKTGFDFLTFIEQYIRDFFAGYDLDAVDIEHLITEYTSEFESRLKNERPELYQQYFLQGFRLETRIAHQKAQESLDRIEKIITTHLGIEDGVFQFGISLDKIESRLMATTQPYEIDLMFFDYDEKNIDEQLTEAKVLEVSYPKSASIMRFISGVYRGDAKIQRSRAEHEYC